MRAYLLCKLLCFAAMGRQREAKAKRPLEDHSWEELHRGLSGGPDAAQRQIELDAIAREIDATASLQASSKRIEFGTWSLIFCTVFLLLVTIVLLAVTVRVLTTRGGGAYPGLPRCFPRVSLGLDSALRRHAAR
jgi:hypothetical protein